MGAQRTAGRQPVSQAGRLLGRRVLHLAPLPLWRLLHRLLHCAASWTRQRNEFLANGGEAAGPKHTWNTLQNLHT